MPNKRLPPKATYGSLLPDNGPGEELEAARLLPLGELVPNSYQFRQVFNTDTLRELAESIAQQGLIEPIIVRPKDGHYEVVAGERRYRALTMLQNEGRGPATVPVIIRDIGDDDAMMITVIENLQREDLDIEDEGRQFQLLIERTGMTQRGLAEALGINRKYIDRRLALIRDPAKLAAYRAGEKNLIQAVVDSEDEESGSRRPTELPEVVERATADRLGTPVAGYTRGGPIPYRDRPLTQMIDFSERVDWRSVPKENRHEVLTRLTMLEEHIARAKQALLDAEGSQNADQPDR